jgi:hypothetical protein
MFEPSCAISVDRLKGNRFRACVALFSLSLFTTGCLLQKKQARVFHYPPAPRPSPGSSKPPPILDPPELPVIATVNTTQELASLIGTGVWEFPPPPPPTPTPRRPPPVKPTTPAPPAAVEAAPTTPRIAQLFTPDQLRENVKIYDDSLGQVQNALDAIGKRNLTADERERVAQIRDFVRQAKQAREEDLMTAVSLAKRADSLAKDLLDRLH